MANHDHHDDDDDDHDHDHEHDDHGHDDHGHDHGHHGHHHHHDPAGLRGGAFAIGAALNVTLVVGQIVAGVLAGSLALLADAGHNAGDVLGLLLAWWAGSLARRPPSARHTYGWGRSTILAAMVNASILLIGVGAIVIEAVHRLASPEPVIGTVMLWAAVAGIVVNGITTFLFARGRQGDLNLRGVFVHMAADTVLSLAVVVGALVIGATGWLWVDPALSLLLAAVIMVSSWNLLRESMSLALDAVPERVDEQAVSAWLAALPGVSEVHDLHIWALSTSETALTAHLVRPGAGPDDALLASACAGLAQRFSIRHATFQIEHGDVEYPCALAPAHVI
jgi:cobalt-zinc-cadmium efflux system protein